MSSPDVDRRKRKGAQAPTAEVSAIASAEAIRAAIALRGVQAADVTDAVHWARQTTNIADKPDSINP